MIDDPKNNRPPKGGEPFDPAAFRIQQEVEEFLRDLSLEFPFPDIFESLRRFEFKERFGGKIVPLPKSQSQSESIREIRERVDEFLAQLRKDYGKKYSDHIEASFRFYTQVTREPPSDS